MFRLPLDFHQTETFAVGAAVHDAGVRVVFRDLWNHKDLGAAAGKFTQSINSHGAGLYRFQSQP